ncbi:MAG: glycosyltransferase [Siphonobacter sp.]
MKEYYFDSISLLVTHYNRSASLENLLTSFEKLNCKFGDIIVSDDGSRPEHLEYIKKIQNNHPFKFVTTKINKGLGNNINKGQDAVKTPYTLYIQEDFEPLAIFPEHLANALSFMQIDPTLDIVRFYAYIPYPYRKNPVKGFSEMYTPTLGLDYTKIYAYSDHPHLRRSTFLKKFGRYAEGIKGDKMEYKMCISFIQNKGKGLFYNDFKSLLKQKNTENEPSTMTRNIWTQSPNFLIKIIRTIYRQIKYNFDIHFIK